MFRRIGCVVAVLVGFVVVAPRPANAAGEPYHASAAASPIAQQNDKDPLTEDEVDQIRDSAIHPDQRIRLYIKFIGQRLDALRELESDPSAPHRSVEISDKLEEFTRLCDEIQDNLDTYDSNHADIRKSLKDLVAASSRWPDEIRAVPADPNYEFSQKMAIESANSALDQAKHLSAEQDVYFDVHKKQRHSNGTGPS